MLFVFLHVRKEHIEGDCDPYRRLHNQRVFLVGREAARGLELSLFGFELLLQLYFLPAFFGHADGVIAAK